MYKIAIIGAGSIGALKDDNVDYIGGPDILTHANAVTAHPEAELCAVVDSDTEKLEKAIVKWNPKDCFGNVEQMYQGLQDNPPDIVIVATPTETHYSVLHDILKYGKPKLVIAEKPFCTNIKEAQDIITLYENANIPIVIDYIRRFSKGHQDIKAIIDAGPEFGFGEIQNCRVLYTRGWHDCCHAVDLMRYFFGECLFAKKMTNSGSINDRDINDQTYSYEFSHQKCHNIIFQACDGREYGIFEIDMLFKKGRIRLIDNGLFYEVYPIAENNKWGHKSLNYALTRVLRKETGLNLALFGLLDNSIQHLSSGKKLLCTASDALEIHSIHEALTL